MIRRKSTWLLAVVIIYSLTSSYAYASRIAVVNRTNNSLDVYDADSYEIVGYGKCGRGPHEVVVSPDETLAYVSDFGDNNNTISIIDLKTYQRVKQLRITRFYGLHGLALSGDGRILYATAEKSKAVIAIDIASEKITQAFKCDVRGSHMLALSPREDVLYSANKGGNVSLFYLDGKRETRYVITGKSCEGLDVTPDGKEVWAAARVAGTLVVVDTEARRRVAEFPIPGQPTRVRISPDGKMAYVSCSEGGVVAVWDIAKRENVANIRVGAHPVGLEISPDSKTVLVGNMGENLVAVIETDNNTVKTRFTVGGQPDGIAWIKD